MGLVVVCFLILLALGVAAPRVAKELERDREVESEHRALEYVRAIQLYYRRNNAYPTSVEQLLGTGTTGVALGGTGQVKYLRQKFKDPLTNDEFRLIRVNEAKTKVKGFFGEPLEGMAPGLGTLAGSTLSPGAAGPGIGGATPGTSSGTFSNGFTNGATPTPTQGAGTSASGSSFGSGTSSFGSGSSSFGSGSSPNGTSTPGTGTAASPTSTDASTFQGSKGPFLGVGSNGKGHGQVEWNGSENIEEWEFLYDPRVEQLKAKVSIFGGTPAASGSGSLGSGFPPTSGTSAPGSSFGSPTTGTGGMFGSSGTSGTSGSSTGTTTGSGTTGTSTGTPTGTGTTPPTQ